VLYRLSRIFLIFIAFLLFVASSAKAKEISAEVSLDRSTITVGDPVLFRLIIRYNLSLKIAYPKLGKHLEKFAIRDFKTLPVRKEDSMKVEEIQYLLTVFEVGSYEIPPLEIRYNDPEEKTIRTPPLKLEVKAVNTEGAQDIRDIKGPLEITWNWRPLARAISLLLLLLGAGWGMFYLIRRWRQSRQKELSDIPEVQLSPEEEALAALKKLQEDGWENVKRFYTEVSDILRRYVGRRYQFGAVEQTSEELGEHLKYKDIGEKPFELVKDILMESDLVKFAKYMPSQKTAENVFPRMKEVIEFTTPKPFTETISNPADSDKVEA
jgi:hypothetical protein